MVHSAYDCLELVRECPAKIESIESYGSKLLVGCSDGSLRIFAPETESSSNGSKSYALEKNLAGFAKKPVLSMAVVESREFLISLSESIAFHRLPFFETIAVITKAKGANVFCWDHRRGLLCFARQKRICIFRHDVSFRVMLCVKPSQESWPIPRRRIAHLWRPSNSKSG